MKLRSLFLLLLFLLLHSPLAVAGEADGSVRIKLTGKLAPGVSKQVTVKEIESVGIVEVEAFNPYEERADWYTGVWLDQLVQRFGGQDVTGVTTKAIDDYQIDFSKSEWEDMRIMVATRVNGHYIGFDKKGPMRIVFPDYDKGLKKYQNNLAKWMWMINRIEFH